jgi:hypothetical protein
MANYTAAARSNTFTVRDVNALKKDLNGLAVTVLVESTEHPNRVLLLCDQSEDGGWPNSRYDEETDDYTDVSIHEIVAKHLAAGHVAVFLQAGHEKLRYIDGTAVAVNGAGETRHIGLEGIYPLAKQLGEHVDVF